LLHFFDFRNAGGAALSIERRGAGPVRSIRSSARDHTSGSHAGARATTPTEENRSITEITSAMGEPASTLHFICLNSYFLQMN